MQLRKARVEIRPRDEYLVNAAPTVADLPTDPPSWINGFPVRPLTDEFLRQHPHYHPVNASVWGIQVVDPPFGIPRLRRRISWAPAALITGEHTCMGKPAVFDKAHLLDDGSLLLGVCLRHTAKGDQPSCKHRNVILPVINPRGVPAASSPPPSEKSSASSAATGPSPASPAGSAGRRTKELSAAQPEPSTAEPEPSAVEPVPSAAQSVSARSRIKRPPVTQPKLSASQPELSAEHSQSEVKPSPAEHAQALTATATAATHVPGPTTQQVASLAAGAQRLLLSAAQPVQASNHTGLDPTPSLVQLGRILSSFTPARSAQSDEGTSPAPSSVSQPTSTLSSGAQLSQLPVAQPAIAQSTITLPIVSSTAQPTHAQHTAQPRHATQRAIQPSHRVHPATNGTKMTDRVLGTSLQPLQSFYRPVNVTSNEQATSKAKNAALLSSTQQLEDALGSTSRKLKDTLAAKAKLEASVKDALSSKATLEGENAALVAKVSELADALAATTREFENARASKAALEDENAALVAKVADIEATRHSSNARAREPEAPLAFRNRDLDEMGEHFDMLVERARKRARLG